MTVTFTTIQQICAVVASVCELAAQASGAEKERSKYFLEKNT